VDEHYNIYVIDFGVSRVSPDDPLEKQTIVCTPTWMAPEVLSKQPYDHKADTYSFALVLWGMLTGKPPYDDIPPVSLPMHICHRNYREKIPIDADPRLSDLITRMWDQNPEKRPNFSEILDFLWNLKDEKTGRYYCHMHDHVPDGCFYYIFRFIKDRRSIWAMGITSKRFRGIYLKWENGTLKKEMKEITGHHHQL